MDAPGKMALIIPGIMIAVSTWKTVNILMLEESEKYIDSKEYFSWERYFTKVLVDRTQDSYLQYRKAKLNAAYLHERNKRTILKSIRGIEF